MTLGAPVVEADSLGKRYRAIVAVDDFSLRWLRAKWLVSWDRMAPANRLR